MRSIYEILFFKIGSYFNFEIQIILFVGIIVGGFIVCWMPFFTMYVVRAFCPQCIPSVLFSILFWLGYCNSAINPCIYALFSRDFRFAFQKILCKCLCTKKSHVRHSALFFRRDMRNDGQTRAAKATVKALRTESQS